MGIVKKGLVFILVVALSAFFSVSILLGIGYLRAEELVYLLAPKDSAQRSLVPRDVDFRATQLENAQRDSEASTGTTSASEQADTPR